MSDLSTFSRDAFLDWIRRFAAAIHENKDDLTQLDAAIGDADHGENMDRGMQAVLNRLPSVADKDIGAICRTVSMTLISTVGGASGPLYGTFFLQMGTVTANKTELTLADWSAALEAGVNGLIMRGKAQPGDKTLIDVFTPALAALKDAAEQGASPADALRRSAQAAEQGRDSTIPMIARKGRASYLGERSVNHVDPGSASACLLLEAVSPAWGA